jgi:hypothetical protein
MSKLEYLKYGLIVAAVVAVVVVGVWVLSQNSDAPQLLFTDRLESMGTPSTTDMNVFSVTLTFKYNNQTITYQGFRDTVEGFKVGVVYDVYLCHDGGYRITQSTNQSYVNGQN